MDFHTYEDIFLLIDQFFSLMLINNKRNALLVSISVLLFVHRFFGNVFFERERENMFFSWDEEYYLITVCSCSLLITSLSSIYYEFQQFNDVSSIGM